MDVDDLFGSFHEDDVDMSEKALLKRRKLNKAADPRDFAKEEDERAHKHEIR